MESIEWLDVSESETLQRRQSETAAGTSKVAERVAAGITVIAGVGSLSDADTIEDEDRRAFQLRGSV